MNTLYVHECVRARVCVVACVCVRVRAFVHASVSGPMQNNRKTISSNVINSQGSG